MKLFQIATAILLSGLAINANAQDKISLRDGTELKVKVKKVTSRDITYKKFDNPDGPEFVVDREDVESIKYENGTEEEMGDDEAPRRSRRSPRMDRDRDHTSYRSRFNRPSSINYGNNILSIAPIQMTNEGPAGVGISYERCIDKSGIFSFNLPLAMTFFNKDYYNYSTSYSLNKTGTFFYAYPGLKIYPAGSKHFVTYSVGPSIALGWGTKYNYNTSYSTPVMESKSVFKSGLMIANGLNIMPTKHFYLGLELGLGFYYSNNDFGYYSTTFGDGDPLVQFNFKMGYRF